MHFAMTTGSESRTCCPANRVMSASSPTTIADSSKRCSTATASEFLGAICRNGLATGRTLTSGSAAEPIKGTSRNAGGRGDAGGWAECLKRSGENGREDPKQPSSRRSRPMRISAHRKRRPAYWVSRPSIYRGAFLEPAAGDGAIVRPLQAAGFTVIASDIVDYGLVGCKAGIDYLEAAPIGGVDGIVTNPPFKLALQFAEKALREVPYFALLLRTNFLESAARLKFFRKHPPARIWICSRRLPMMHRHGWQGRRAPSNTCHAWFVSPASTWCRASRSP